MANNQGQESFLTRVRQRAVRIWPDTVTFMRTPFGKKFFFWFAVAISVLTIAVVSLGVTQESFICYYCHAVRGEWEAWKVGPHKDVECKSCHIGPGTLGFLFYITDASVSIYATITGEYERPIKVDVRRRECITCHEEVIEKTIRVKKLKMSHNELQPAGLWCTRCHAATGHPRRVNAFFQERQPQMPSCFEKDCHNGRRGASGCNECHTRNLLANATLEEPASRTHDIRADFGSIDDIDTCLGCHQQRFCGECHGVELPHPLAFLDRHFDFVDQLGADICTDCHKNNVSTPRGCFGGECHPREPGSF